MHSLTNGLKAKLIVKNSVSIKQFGAKGDGTTDDTEAIQNAIDYVYNFYVSDLSNSLFKNKNIVKLNAGRYRITNTIEFNILVRLQAEGNCELIADFNGTAVYCSSELSIPSVSGEATLYKQGYISGNIIDSTTGSLTIRKKSSFYTKQTTETGSVGLEIGNRELVSSSEMNLARCSFNNINIYEFETALALNSVNLYCVTFNNLHLEKNYYNIYWGYSGNKYNAGEKITFKDCVIAGAQYGLYLNTSASSVSFEDCSFDFLRNLFLCERL